MNTYGTTTDAYDCGYRLGKKHGLAEAEFTKFTAFDFFLNLFLGVTITGLVGLIGIAIYTVATDIRAENLRGQIIEQRKLTASAVVEDAEKEKVKVSYRNDTDKTIGKIWVTLTGTQSNRSSSILENKGNTFVLDVIAKPGETVSDTVTVIPRANIELLSYANLQAKVIDFTYLEDVSDYTEAQKERAGTCPAPAPTVAPTSASARSDEMMGFRRLADQR